MTILGTVFTFVLMAFHIRVVNLIRFYATHIVTKKNTKQRTNAKHSSTSRKKNSAWKIIHDGFLDLAVSSHGQSLGKE